MCLPLDYCCCCFSLEVGAQIISLISTIVSAGVAVLYGSTAALLLRRHTRATFYGVVALSSVIQCLCGCLLIGGTFSRRPKLMWPWLAVSCLGATALLITSIVGAGTLIYNGEFEVTADVNIMISIYFLYSLLLFYFLSVVNSRRAELVRQQNGVVLRPTPTAWKYV